MGRINEYLERKAINIINAMDDETLAAHTIAKGDAALDYINNTSAGLQGIDSGRHHDLMTDPGGFVYKSEIITKKAYFYQKPVHREIVFTHNTIMDAAIKKIKDAITSVEPIFSIPNDEDLDDPEEHLDAKKGWKKIFGKEVLRKAIEKSIKHGCVIYEPLDIPEADLEWYTNAPFFIRAWDEIKTRSEFKYGMATEYFIHPSNRELKGYKIDITLNSKKGVMHARSEKDKDKDKSHSGLFFDPDNTDDHNGKPWFLGCWDNIIDYESIKEARNSYDEQIGNGFIVVGIPSKDYDKVKETVKSKIKNIRREQGLVIPINKEQPMAIEFKGSQFQIDFNADLNDIRRDIIANIGFPERWLFGDSEGAMESSGKDRMQVHDQIKQIFSKWKRFIKLILKYHGYISSFDEIEIKAPYELQLTEAEKAEIDNLKIQTLDMKSRFLSLDEIRAELGEEPIDPSELSGNVVQDEMGNKPDEPNDDQNNDDNLDEAKTSPNEEKDKKDSDDELPYEILDSIIQGTKHAILKEWWDVSGDTVTKIRRNMRENKQTLVKTDSIMLDSIQLGPDLWSSSGLIVPAQTKFYKEYNANFIRSPSQLLQAFDRQKSEQLPIGVYQSNGHDEGSDVGELAQFGEARLEKADELGIHGTIVYDLTKVDEILGKDNWIRKRLKETKRIPTSVGLISTDVPIDKKTKYELNHKIKSFVATQFPRNESAGID